VQLWTVADYEGHIIISFKQPLRVILSERLVAKRDPVLRKTRLSTLVGPQEKDRLLRKYWSIPERLIETSVVLADPKWWGNRREVTG
jgi:hypothetical protein